MTRIKQMAGTFFRKVRANEMTMPRRLAFSIGRSFAGRVGNASLPSIGIAGILVTGIHAADLAFQSGFSSGMVLQREKPVLLSGTGKADSTISITIASHTLAANVDSNGLWSATLPPMKAGGPFTLSATEGANSAKIGDILIGDVWVCSGQSNMQMGLAEAIGGEEAIAALSRESTIRFLEVPRGGADSPQTSLKAEWKHGTPESLAKFSAVGGFFAAHLHRDPALANIPLGIINSSFGGTSIEAWTPAASLADIPKDQISGSMFGIPPGALFNQMIHPLFARSVKGVLWYQGEANAGQPALYVRLLRNLMDQWRAGWKQPELPFLIVQLPAFDGKMGGLDFGWLREAEIQACFGFPNAWSAATYDTTDGIDLHPKEKQQIGERLALIAKREVYGLNVQAHGPLMEKAEVSGDQLVVTFDQELKAPDGKNALGFAIAGDDGDFHFANAILKGKSAILKAEGVSKPKIVRYAWGGLTDANVTNQAGLPAFPFRTDQLPPESVVFQPLPTFRKIETPIYQLETGTNGRIASLIVGGKQFLSNELNGGTAVPGGWGFRNLGTTTVLGPRRIRLSDGAVGLEVACLPNEMTWTLSNHGGDPVDLHINLASEVEVHSNGPSITLSRGNTRIQLRGVDRVEDHRLFVKAAANTSSELHISIENP